MKRDLGFTFTIIVSMATFAIALIAGIFLVWQTGNSAIAQESTRAHSAQVSLDATRAVEPQYASIAN
jgi:hypothetical protein